MSKLYRELISSSPSQAPGSYIYSLLPVGGDRLAVLTSGDEVLSLEKTGLRTVSRHHKDVPASVSSMTGCENANDVVICGGGDGVVAIFDLRSQRRVSHIQADRPVTALAHHNNEFAAGLELAHSQATISVWDQRAMRIRWQSSENSDDVTALQYHPSHDDRLLSGGDDGLVSIFDTSIQDEMDSLIQAFAHGPVHKAGFLCDTKIYALSADQQFSIQPVESPDSDGPNIIQPVVFGDLRPVAECDYVIDVLPNTPHPYVVTGSHLCDPHIDFIPLVANPELTFDADNIIRLQGAHGEEIVRSICLGGSDETIFTGGEDGCVKGFVSAGTSIESSSQPASSLRKGKKGEGRRFKPY